MVRVGCRIVGQVITTASPRLIPLATVHSCTANRRTPRRTRRHRGTSSNTGTSGSAANFSHRSNAAGSTVTCSGAPSAGASACSRSAGAVAGESAWSGLDEAAPAGGTAGAESVGGSWSGGAVVSVEVDTPGVISLFPVTTPCPPVPSLPRVRQPLAQVRDVRRLPGPAARRLYHHRRLRRTDHLDDQVRVDLSGLQVFMPVATRVESVSRVVRVHQVDPSGD